MIETAIIVLRQLIIHSDVEQIRIPVLCRCHLLLVPATLIAELVILLVWQTGVTEMVTMPLQHMQHIQVEWRYSAVEKLKQFKSVVTIKIEFMILKINVSLMTLIMTTVLFGFGVQNAFAQAAPESASYTFPDTPVKKYDRATLDRISRLSEKYIMSTITLEELTELKTLDSDFSDIDKYKAEYEVTERARVHTATDEEMNNRVVVPGTLTVSPMPMDYSYSVAGPFGKYNDLALPLSLINTLLILMLIARRSKVA